MYACGINFFMVPAGLYSGGVMGICQVIRTLLWNPLHLELLSFDIAGIIYYVFNIPLLILAYKLLGKNFIGLTLTSVTLMSLFLTVVPSYQVVSDPMAACVVGGIISGAGTGIILRSHGSGGGMDVVGMMMIQKSPDASVGRVNLLVNIILYCSCLFLFDMNIVVYSVIYAAVSSVAMDRMHTQNIAVSAHIITRKDPSELEKAILIDLHRGVTKWDSVGAYTSEGSHILYVMLSKYELPRLRRIVNEIDPHAFVVLEEGVTVLGNYEKKL